MAALQYKDDHNKIAYLGRERGCEDFTDILSYLDHSPLRYALTHAPPVVFDSLVKQFWATAVVRPNAAGSHDLVATIAGREVVVTESLIRTQLHFDDANGIFNMPNSDILEGMRVIGYPTDRALTFFKHHLSPQWRFLVHTLMHCLSPKSGSWNQFPSSIATALICLSTDRVYNFSRFILEGMIGNVKATKNKFLMYPRFLQMIVAIETADRTPRPTFGFTRKLFANMKFKWEGQPMPLTPPMLAIAAAGDAADEDNAAAHEAAGSTAEAHPEPHSPPVSPVREPTPERQPETEWVVPNPVSPLTDWRPWPSVPAHSPIRGPTPEPASPPTPPAQTFIFEEPLVFGPPPRPAGGVDPDVIESIIFGPQPRPHGYVDPDFVEPIIFGPQPRPDNYREPEDLDNPMEDDTTHGGFHVESPVRPDDAPTPTADAAGRAKDPSLLTDLSAKLDRCMGRIRISSEKLSWEVAGKFGGVGSTSVPSEDVEEREEEEVPLRPNLSAGPSVAADKGKAPMPDLDIPAEFLAEDAQARKRFEEEQASERLVQQLQAEALAQEDLQIVSEQRAKELDELMMRMTETDWLNLMMQVGSNPALARELLGADVTEDNFIERMTAIKEKKKRALADLRYRALKGKPMKQSEVTQMMRNLVKNQWCAAHNGTITMTAVKAMTKQQLIEEYEYICRRLEKDRLLSAQYNLFRPKPAITEPPSKRQRVEHVSSPTVFVPAVTTHTADDPDSAGGGGSHPAGSAFGTPVTDSTVPTPAAMDSAGSHHEIGVSPFADSAASSSPSNLSTDHIPLDFISGDGVVLVDKLPDDEIVDPRVKVETVTESAASPPRSRRKNLGVRSADFLWDQPVEDFFSSESESDDDMEHYIPPLPYGEFKDWEMVSCPPGNNHIHVYYQQNRRRKYFTYLKELLPHVYREDLLLLRRRMNRYFRLNPDVDVGLDLWRDVNLLCQSLHSDDVEDFWRTQDEWIVCSWKLYPKSSVHVLDLTNGKTVYMFVDKFYLLIEATLLNRCYATGSQFHPSYCRCRDVVVAGSVIQTVQTSLRQSYECLASAPFACTARQMVFSSPWLTAKKESGSPLQTALVCNSNPVVDRLLEAAVLLLLLPHFDALFIEFMLFQLMLLIWMLLLRSSSIPADYVSAGHVLVSADRDRIC
ncbi:hypothetical protein Tco_0873358 [Tanacetum coccineum]